LEHKNSKKDAGVAELVDVLDLGSSAARRGGSKPSARTNNPLTYSAGGFFYLLISKISSFNGNNI
jgi:hypothetical protein